jgi:hypothetical protein
MLCKLLGALRLVRLSRFCWLGRFLEQVLILLIPVLLAFLSFLEILLLFIKFLANLIKLLLEPVPTLLIWIFSNGSKSMRRWLAIPQS